MAGQSNSLVDRLMRRNDPGLQRVATPDGGEVFKGPTARRALRALNARAFTMDETIFVDDDFDLSNAEDQALYAHERHHQMESGGSDGGGGRDHEEMAARAIESMVLHRSKGGEDFGSIMRDIDRKPKGTRTPNQGLSQGQLRQMKSASKGNKGDDPMNAYFAMRATGKSHETIVRELAQFVMESLMRIQEEANFRAASSTDFL